MIKRSKRINYFITVKMSKRVNYLKFDLGGRELEKLWKESKCVTWFPEGRDLISWKRRFEVQEFSWLAITRLVKNNFHGTLKHECEVQSSHGFFLFQKLKDMAANQLASNKHSLRFLCQIFRWPKIKSPRLVISKWGTYCTTDLWRSPATIIEHS